MKRRRGYPENVSEFKDVRGKYRLRFRAKGRPTYYPKAKFGTPEFEVELTKWREGEAYQAPVEPRHAAGTIGDLITRFYEMGALRNMKPMTRRKVRGVLDRFRDTVDAKGVKYADKSAATIPFDRLGAIFTRKAEQHPAAARELRKQLIRVFDFAIKLGIRTDNPAKMTEPVKVRTEGFHTWTEEEIDQFRAKHPLGTNARLAMELMLWTGQRKGDAVKMGWKDIDGGRIIVTQEKTGKRLRIKMAPQLVEAIRAMPVTGRDTFLVTSFGKPYTANGFGNAFKDWCRDADLPHCCTHGLRKANARRGAELGATNQQLKAVGGWSNDAEVSTYTAGAEQTILADQIIDRVSEWEANKVSPLANSLTGKAQ